MRKLLALVVILLLYSCGEEMKDPQVEQGYDFYPVKLGQYRIYEVDERLYTGSQPDSSHYFMKEVITDSLVAGDHSVRYLLYRFTTEDTLQAQWKIDSVWTVRRNNRQVIVAENNVSYVKLVFPVRDGQSWNGNAFNSREPQMYYYESVGHLSYFGMDFFSDDAIRVVIEDIPENLVEQDERSEIYVRGIGLAEKDYISVRFCRSGCPPGQIEEGRIYRQRLIEYGEE